MRQGSDPVRALAALDAVITEAAAVVEAEERQAAAVWIADAERHMRVAHSWLARLNATTGPVILQTLHPALGRREFRLPAACPCAVLCDAGEWFVNSAHVTSVTGLVAVGREPVCAGDCRVRWLVSLQDAWTTVEAFASSNRVITGTLVRANVDAIDVAARRDVVTLPIDHVTAIRVVR